MRFIRNLFRHLLNNDQLINKLAESKPIRQSAQFVVYILIKTGTINVTRRILYHPRELIQQLQGIGRQLKQRLEDIKNDLKKYPPK